MQTKQCYFAPSLTRLLNLGLLACLASAVLVLLLSSLDANAAAPDSLVIAPGSYVVKTLHPGPTPGTFVVEGRVGAASTGVTAYGVTARIVNAPSPVTLIDRDVMFGTVEATGAVVRSTDTFLVLVRPDPALNAFQLYNFTSAFVHELQWEFGCDGCGNRPPVADAGEDRTTQVYQPTTLDGSRSWDADGDPLTFLWSVASAPAGSEAQISSTTSIRPVFTPDVEGAYSIHLVVSDGETESSTSIAIVSTSNSRPVAHAGSDQTVTVGSEVQLDASHSSDIDGDPLIFEWRFAEKPNGSEAFIEVSDPAAPYASFIVDKPGRYIVELMASDFEGGKSDRAVISTINSRPIADAGPDRSARIGETVQLTASTSRDVDGDPLAFKWSLTAPAGSDAVLMHGEGLNTSFTVDHPGDYLVQLIANDGREVSEADTVVVSTMNSKPEAVAKAEQSSVTVGMRVQMDGASSYDVDGDDISFEWSLIALPLESTATVDHPEAPYASFVPDHPGIYIAQLIVHDGTAVSSPVSIEISAHAVTSAPQITVITPTNGLHTNEYTVTFEGHLDRPVLFMINGNSVELRENATFSHFIQLREGLNAISLVAEDAYGRTELEWQIIRDRTVPVAPAKAFIAIEEDGAGNLIVSGTEGSVEPHAVVSVRTSAGNTASGVADALGAFSIVVVGDETHEVFIQQTDQAGNSSETIQTDVLDSLSFVIDWPMNQQIVQGNSVTVRGHVSGRIGVGLAANGVPAAIVGTGSHRPFAVTVPLATAGPTTIMLVATDPDGQSVQQELTLVRSAGLPFAVEASVQEGASPLRVSFDVIRLDGTGIRRVEADFDGNGAVDIEHGSRPGSMMHEYTRPGLYRSSFRIQSQDGAWHSLEVPLTVHSPNDLEYRIQATWNRFMDGLNSSSVETLLSTMTPQMAREYGEFLIEIRDSLAAVAQSTSSPKLTSFYGDIAEYSVIRTIDAHQYEYLIYFLRGTDGIWRIASL